MIGRCASGALIAAGVWLSLHAEHVNGAPASTTAPAAGIAVRRVTTVLRLDANGVSEPMDFAVPPDTRGLTMVVEGDSRTLYGLASLHTSDGVEHVGLDLKTSHGTRMEERYYAEKIGVMPGGFYQNVRLGTFTAIYPNAPDQSLAAGAARVRVLSNATRGAVTVTVLMPEEDGSRTLHINVIEVSDYPSDGEPPGFLPEARSILAQAGIQIVVDQTRFMRRTGFSSITEWSEPAEAPGSQLARLALEGRRQVSSDALNVFIVDSLPRNVFGVSLGTPGPPIRSSYYYAVVLRRVASSLMARVFSHELAHFLGLQHPLDVTPSGTRYTDPLSDTEPGTQNLMEGTGTSITPGQAFVLSRSALLRRR